MMPWPTVPTRIVPFAISTSPPPLSIPHGEGCLKLPALSSALDLTSAYVSADSSPTAELLLRRRWRRWDEAGSRRSKRRQHFLTHQLDAAHRVFVRHVAVVRPHAHVADAEQIAH